MIGTATILSSILALGVNPASTKEELESRWRREYPSAAGRWGDIDRGFVANGHSSLRWFAGFTTLVKELKVVSSGDKRLFVQGGASTTNPKSPVKNTPTIVECRTRDYRFRLTKSSDSDKFIIVNYGKNDVEDMFFENDFQNLAQSATHFFDSSFLERMQSPTFDLKSIETLDREAGELVRIRYTFTFVKQSLTESATVDLDPGKDWAIRRVDAMLEGPKGSASGARTVDVSYKRIDGTRFFPVRTEFFNRTPKPNVYEHSILEYDRVTFGDVPQEVFTLPAYGLPDLPLRPSPRASMFTFRNPILWLAFASSVICFFLLWFLRRRNVRAA